jgi:hypothetical protein
MRRKTRTKMLTIMLTTTMLLTSCSKPAITSELLGDNLITSDSDQRKTTELIKNQEVDASIQSSSEVPQNQGITVNKIAYEVMDEATLSETILTELESLKLVRGYTYWLQEDGSYLIFIGAGEKPTGGHTIEVVSIEDNEGKTNISVAEAPPGDNVRVMQILTYPYVVIQASGITDQFNIRDQEQIEYQIILLEEGTCDTGTDNIGANIHVDDENHRIN